MGIQSIPKLTTIACILWFVFCAVGFSDAGSDFLSVLIALTIAALWGSIWLIRLTVYWLRRRSGNRQPEIFSRPAIYWTLEPIVLIVSLALSALGIFSFIRFTISERSLTDYVERVRSGEIILASEFNYPSRQVGLYTIAATDLLPDGTVRMLTSSHSLLDRAGFAHSPANPPPRQGEDSYQYLYGHWWYWFESW